MMKKDFLVANLHWILFSFGMSWLVVNGLTMPKGTVIASYNLFFGIISVPLILFAFGKLALNHTQTICRPVWIYAFISVFAITALTFARGQDTIFSYYQAAIFCSSILLWGISFEDNGKLFQRFRDCAIVVLVVSVSIPLAYSFYPSVLGDRDMVADLPGFGNVRIYGQAASISGYAAIGLIFASYKKALPLVVLAVSAYVVLWSGTRSSVAGFIMVIVACSVFEALKKTSLKRLVAKLSIITSMFVVAAILASHTPLPAGEYGVFERAQNTFEENGDISSNRFEIWAALTEATIEKPIFGWGYLMLGELDHPDVTVGEAHNYIIDFIFGWGFPVGVAVTLLLFGSFSVAFYRASLTASYEPLMALSVAAGLLATGLFGGVMTTAFSRLVLFVALGTALGWPYVRSPKIRKTDAKSHVSTNLG